MGVSFKWWALPIDWADLPTGLNRDIKTQLLGERETNTATKQAGSFVQLEKKGKKCEHCTSTLQSKQRRQPKPES